MRQTFIEVISLFFEIVVQFILLIFSIIRIAGLILRANADVIIACVIGYIIYLSIISFKKGYDSFSEIEKKYGEFGVKKEK